jgi:D-sedoheptulose 7-phosphate isomerase
MSDEPTAFLYPFIDAEETDEPCLLGDLARSALSKIAEHEALIAEMSSANAGMLREAGRKVSERVRQGGRLFTFGNGGSATDAMAAAALFCGGADGTAIPARSLVADQAVLTALGNDVGFELVFSRQLIAYGRAGDVAVAFSTSGNSENLLRALREASGRGLLTIGFSGYDGGAMAVSGDLDYCFVVASASIHRIQEAQDALVLALWSAVQDELGAV